jgi:hypothetical protein
MFENAVNRNFPFWEHRADKFNVGQGGPFSSMEQIFSTLKFALPRHGKIPGRG